MNDLSRELGGALGIAVLGSLLQSTYRADLQIQGVPQLIAAQLRSSFATASHVAPSVAQQAHAAFIDGMHLAMWCAAGVAVLAAAGVTALLRRS
ncbi:MAG TPA: hypothetical protein VFG00_09085 [Acidothermaceae bacterium]|nr:hypothetical protein [Acidothermaceae bacterium]